jgi:hypothetical protein
VLFETFFTRFDFAAHERWPISTKRGLPVIQVKD